MGVLNCPVLSAEYRARTFGVSRPHGMLTVFSLLDEIMFACRHWTSSVLRLTRVQGIAIEGARPGGIRPATSKIPEMGHRAGNRLFLSLLAIREEDWT